MLVVFIMLQKFVMPLSSKPIFNELLKMYYEVQIQVPMIRITRMMVILFIYTLKILMEQMVCVCIPLKIYSSSQNLILNLNLKANDFLYMLKISFTSNQRNYTYFIYNRYNNFSHLHTNISHIYFFTNICGATILQAHFL